jgi:quinol monooxygenase YgiN
LLTFVSPFSKEQRGFTLNGISRTVVQIKTDKRDDVDEFISRHVEEISSIEGLLHWGYMYSDENEITVIAVYENNESAQNATPRVNTILGDLAPLMAAPPIRNIYDATWY